VVDYLNLEEVLGRSIELLKRLLACVGQGLHLEVVDGQGGFAGVRAVNEVGGAKLPAAGSICRKARVRN
jgi:hypothetical protein